MHGHVFVLIFVYIIVAFLLCFNVLRGMVIAFPKNYPTCHMDDNVIKPGRTTAEHSKAESFGHKIMCVCLCCVRACCLTGPYKNVYVSRTTSLDVKIVILLYFLLKIIPVLEFNNWQPLNINLSQFLGSKRSPEKNTTIRDVSVRDR